MSKTSFKTTVEWHLINWRKLERQVYKLQKRIYQASRRGDVKTFRRLQKLLMKSWYARVLAVRRVTQDNQGKKQNGKCAHCGLFFREDDVMEVDHIIPKSQGGKDEYKNLQLLHRHCHDTKTASDGSKGTQSDCNSVKPKPTEPEIKDTFAPLKRLVKEVGKWVMRWV